MADDAHAKPRAEHEVIMLWPDGPPESRPDIGPEIAFQAPGGSGGPPTTMLRNVSTPSLSVFLPDPARANGIGVIVAPRRRLADPGLAA